MQADFADPSHGWLAHLEPTGASNSLQRTTDGGATWRIVRTRPDLGSPGDVPVIAPVAFTNPWDGWLGGGVFAYGALYSTHDGGRRWHPVTVTREGEQPHVLADVPTSTDGSLILPLTIVRRHRVRLRVTTSSDGGTTWRPLATKQVYLARRAPFWHAFRSLPTALPTAIVDSDVWWIGVGSKVYRTTDAGRTWTSLRAPVALRDISAVDASTAWLSSDGGLFETRNGGRSWSTLLPR